MAIFGGTFDPIHNAHLSIARAAADTFALARVLFVPNGRPPHRQPGSTAGYADRLRMVELACAGDPRFEPSNLEDNPVTSYSIHTIERVRDSLHPEPLYFLIGADAFAEIRSWHRWQEVVQAVVFIVVSRPGSFYEIPFGARVERLEGIQLPVSSSEIRSRLSRGETGVPVPPAVAGYIHEHGLYR